MFWVQWWNTVWGKRERVQQCRQKAVIWPVLEALDGGFRILCAHALTHDRKLLSLRVWRCYKVDTNLFSCLLNDLFLYYHLIIVKKISMHSYYNVVHVETFLKTNAVESQSVENTDSQSNSAEPGAFYHFGLEHRLVSFRDKMPDKAEHHLLTSHAFLSHFLQTLKEVNTLTQVDINHTFCCQTASNDKYIKRSWPCYIKRLSNSHCYTISYLIPTDNRNSKYSPIFVQMFITTMKKAHCRRQFVEF